MRTACTLFLAALAVTGCSSSQPPSTPAGASTVAPEAPNAPSDAHPHGGHGAHHDMAKMCPMAVAGTTAKAEDTKDGVAVVFATTGDVAELRRRVAAMADKHNGKHAEGHSCMMHGGSPMPAAEARAEDVEGGARLSFAARDAADLGALRAHVGRHAELMASGSCPMMKGHDGGGHGHGGPHDGRGHGRPGAGPHDGHGKSGGAAGAAPEGAP